jgi:hypothetical protein
VVDDLFEGIQAFLDGKRVLVMRGTEEVGCLAGSNEVGCAGETDGKRMELRPGGKWVFIVC